ncbi:MAG: hypothetical protein KAT85_09485, partial [candidate division Zixibacteria bacterium]|nr:hypothetical protein [candidate division Zixibacteria bacterium]
YGVFAVLALREPSHPGTISFEFVEANPYCNGYVGPHHYYSQPKFVWRVVDWYSEIDPEMFEIKLDGYYIHKFGSDADFWSTSWDAITQELRIYPYHGGYESGGDFASDLECGDHTLYIGAKNKQANFASMTWEFTVDCTPPTVVFDNYYVTKNPVITFSVNDDLAGVDWDHVFVDVVAYESNNIDLENPNQDENLFFLGTFFPGQVEYYADGATGEVTITTTYDLEHKRGIMVAIYDGTRSSAGTYDYSYGDPVAYGDWRNFYEHGHGVWDCVGNVEDPWFQVLTIDNTGPVVVRGDDRCDDLEIIDDGSGVDPTMFEIYEDGALVTSGYSYDANTGYMSYCPTGGAEVTFVTYDNAGNRTVEIWVAVGQGEVTDNGDGFNWPNPFDPNVDGFTTIESNFTSGGGVTITIYDFAGNEVRTLNASVSGVATWNGRSSDGEVVANGVYFAYCKASDGSHKVVKIAVIKE